MVLKRWLLFIVVFTISLTVILSLLTYSQSRAPFNDANKAAENYVLKNHLLAEVNETYVYNSVATFHTVIGSTSKGEQKAFFVPDDATKESTMEVSLKDGITEKQAIKMALENEKSSEILHVKLGVEEVGPVWEIAFINEENSLNYVYILFNKGDWWKRISNL